MGEVLSEVGDLVFSLVIGYLGALEFLYVARHLYHWTFRHPDGNDNDADSLKRLQENMRNQLAAADARETNVGTNAMQDGVPYKDGFRIDPQQQEIEKLKAEQKLQEEKEKRRKEIEVELARQKKIEDETRQQLERAEAELERQRKQAATDEEKRNTIALLEAEREREKQQRMLEEQREAEENAQRLLAAEKYKELIQRQCEEQERADEENATHILEIERLQEVKQRRLEVEQELAEAAAKQEQLLAAEKMRILEIERLKEVEQGRLEEEHELAEAVQQEDKLLTEERERDMLQQAQELEQHELAEAVQQKDKLLTEEREREMLQQEQELEQHELAEAVQQEDKLLTEEREREMLQQAQELEEEEADEQARLLLDAEREQERKQRTKEENARKFMDAEQRMVEELERQKGEAVHQHQLSATQPVFEEPCIKRIVAPLTESERSQPRTVKTQFGQTSNEAYSVNSKPLLFSEVSDDATTVEPTSSQYSDGTQPSEDMSTGTDQTMLMVSVLGNELELEREAPDGEDNSSTVQYTDEYLRSLDGIKQRPLVREDGSGRRRAFKKRRSSGSSNSSRESRTSREEELKMFTSLEEEENDGVNKEVDDFTAIKYSSEPTLKVRTPQRRHKRSPAKDAKTSPSISNESLKGSLEMLGEEATDPWGEVVPEHYKDTAFWKREKAMSIDEEEIELERPVGKENTHESDNDTAATNMPKTSSFEEATYSQHEEILSELQQQPYKDTEEEKKVIQDETRNDKNTNLIFSGEYTKAMNKDWHSGHFCCWQCDESLTGQRYVIRDDHPYCIGCYENVFANNCEECNKIIGIDSKDLSYKDKHWHEACFLCCKCHLSLVDKQFGAKAEKIYCSGCYDSQFASRCDGCGDVFRAGTKKMEYKTRQWHEKCFCCCVCKTVIGTKSFIPREQEIYCAGCYEEKFATRCIKCNKVITSGGVTYKNEPWHRECFTCTHCNMTLAGQRFTSRDEKPYCAECFGELFAKRCTACVKPITGIGGTRFISFEDRHWHHDCFVCASCKASLVGRGFITDGPDIICPECAKQKLM